MATDIAIVNRDADRDFCEIPTTRRIFDLVSLCKECGYIGLIVGNPGVGKTTALARFAHNDPYAHLCTMSPAIKSMSGVLMHVCRVLGAIPARTVTETHEILCNRSMWTDEKEVLLIDEAQHLHNQAIDELRCIHDQSKMAMVFCGNAEFHTRFNKARAAAFAQFTSRIGMRLEIWEPTDADITAIRQHYDIEGEKEHAYIQLHAKTTGGLRSVAALIRVARALAGPNNPVRLEHLKASAGMQGME